MQEETLLHKTREALARALVHPDIHDSQKNAITDFLVEGTVTVYVHTAWSRPNASINRRISQVFGELRNIREHNMDEKDEIRQHWLDAAVDYLNYCLDRDKCLIPPPSST